MINIVTRRIIKQSSTPWCLPALTLREIIGPHEKVIRKAIRTMESYEVPRFVETLISPRLKEIEKLAGQEMNALYLAYLVVHTLTNSR